jgi:hypothetical protein
MAVDARNVYWLAFGFSDNPSDHLLSVPVAGGHVTTLASGEGFTDLAIDDAKAYWTTRVGAAPGTAGTVMSVPLTGGPSTPLASSQVDPHGIDLAAGQVYWACNNSSAQPLGTAGEIFSEPTSGGNPTVVGGYAASPFEVTTNSMSVFWSATYDYMTMSSMGSASAVLTAPFGGGTATQLVSLPGGSSLGPIAVDDASLYYSAFTVVGDGRIIKLPLNGAKPVTMASVTPAAMVVDATSLYWTEPIRGNVMRLTPK